MYVCNVCKYVCNICMYVMYLCMYVCMYVCMFITVFVFCFNFYRKWPTLPFCRRVVNLSSADGSDSFPNQSIQGGCIAELLAGRCRLFSVFPYQKNDKMTMLNLPFDWVWGFIFIGLAWTQHIQTVKSAWR